MLILDSGAVTRLAERSRRAAALILALREQGLWPPIVPSIVLVECLQGQAGRDALANRFLKTTSWRRFRNRWRGALRCSAGKLVEVPRLTHSSSPARSLVEPRSRRISTISRRSPNARTA